MSGTPASTAAAIAWRGLSLLALITATAECAAAQPAASSIRINLDKASGTISPALYGYMVELTLSSFEGTSWSEMLVDRKFGIFPKTVGMDLVRSGTAEFWEPISAGGDITLLLDPREYYCAPYSQFIVLGPTEAQPAGVQQKGYQHVLPHFGESGAFEHPLSVHKGIPYAVRLAMKARDGSIPIHVGLGKSPKEVVAETAFDAKPGEWTVQQAVLTPDADLDDARFMIWIDTPGAVWVDAASLRRQDLTDKNGFRSDVVAATREHVRPTVIRWPGGCFVEDYHWQDGIGPIDRRPMVYSRPWDKYYTNDIGTDEFMALCRALDAEPYISVNLGSATAEEAAAWVEYCNGAADTKWGSERAKNGHAEPYGVKYWNIGNENNLSSEIGWMSANEYSRTLNEFAEAMRAVDPTIKLVSVGEFAPLPEIVERMKTQSPQVYAQLARVSHWTDTVIGGAGVNIDYYSKHYYWPENVDAAKDFEQVFAVAMSYAANILPPAEQCLAKIDKAAPAGKHIPLAWDEWGVRVDEGPQLPPVPGELKIGSPPEFGFYGSIRDLMIALGEAGMMNAMLRRPDEFGMSNKTLLFGYAAGDVAVSRDAVAVSPPGLMMGLYSTHDSCTAVPVDVDCGSVTVVPVKDSPFGPTFAGPLPLLDVSARLHPDSKTLDLFVVNRSLKDDIETSIVWVGRTAAKIESCTLNAPAVNYRNTFEKPETVKVISSEPESSGEGMTYSFPAHSLTRLVVELD